MKTMKTIKTDGKRSVSVEYIGNDVDVAVSSNGFQTVVVRMDRDMAEWLCSILGNDPPTTSSSTNISRALD